jgi:2-hydroxychromene-2-carboxylate isomerase
VSAPEIDADIHFYWDPVCPFAWMTSRWVHQVIARKDYSVDWRFISLRIVNRDVDYDRHFPPEYEQGHTAGLRMLRVAASVRAEHGRPVMQGLYTAMGSSVFDVDPPDRGGPARDRLGTPDHVGSILGGLGLPEHHVAALDDDGWDDELTAETDEALSRTGRDVGTPIIAFRPPDGPSFFGPVISRLPSDDDAVALWDSVVHLATFPGFAELKRSLRELPRLRALGVGEDEVGAEEDWHGGSRRQTQDRG